jgi:3-phenylpropionate/cinnamic acid dioxygenase small subunit
MSANEWAVLREVELLLFREAELADSNMYDDWFNLWAKDSLLYWAPCNADIVEPQRHVSLIYDDRSALEERIFRLNTRHAHSQRPKSRLTRLVSNVILETGFDVQQSGWVSSRFVLSEMRRDRAEVWAGRARHELVREGGTLRIKQKHVFLVNNDAVMGNLTFLV